MRSAGSWLKKGYATLLDTLFPPQCVACRTALSDRSPHPCLCGGCFGAIEIHPHLTCPRCGRRLPLPENTCHPETGYLLAAAAPYRHAAARELVHALKYAGARDAARTIGALLGECLNALPELDTRTYLTIPIPLHKRRERERGFNQSLLITQALGAHVPLECRPELLRRVRYTPSQTKTAGYAERRGNVAGSFAAENPAAVKRRNVLLIDDVYTSGATMGEAARTLKGAGARTIIALTFAKG